MFQSNRDPFGVRNRNARDGMGRGRAPTPFVTSRDATGVGSEAQGSALVACDGMDAVQEGRKETKRGKVDEGGGDAHRVSRRRA